MFATLDTVLRALRRIAKRIEPAALSPAAAARLIDWASAVERLAVGIRVRASRCIDDTVAGAEGENGPARWLARHTGQPVTQATRDIEASGRLDALPKRTAQYATASSPRSSCTRSRRPPTRIRRPKTIS